MVWMVDTWDPGHSCDFASFKNIKLYCYCCSCRFHYKTNELRAIRFVLHTFLYTLIKKEPQTASFTINL